MKYSSLHDVVMRTFPPPHFMDMPSVGLDITDQRVRFLELTQNKQGLVVNRYDEMRIPPGVIVSGEIKRPKELKQALKKFRRTYNLEFVHVSLPEERAYLVKMTVPEVSAEEIRNAITFQLEEYVPVPPEETVFDYHIIGPAKGKKGELEVAVSVLARKEVNEYVDMFTETGLTPLSFEIEAQAIARAVIPKGDMGTYMVLDFGGTRTGISVVSRGVVRFTSTVDVGSSMITRALEKHFNISTEEADKMKNEKGITRNHGDQEFREAVMVSVSILRDEVNKLFIYWQTHRLEEDGQGIEKVYICGGGANLRGLPEYLSSSLRTKALVANPWVNVNSLDRYIPDIKQSNALGYASVIGLALTKTSDTL